MKITPKILADLAAYADGKTGESAAVWLLTQHGHWPDRLAAAGLIHTDPEYPDYARICWGQVAPECLVMGDRALIGTVSEWQVLRVAVMLTGRHALSIADLGSLDETNLRLVLTAMGWAARGRSWAEGLGLVVAPADGCPRNPGGGHMMRPTALDPGRSCAYRGTAEATVPMEA